jgi:hypothetical protein
MAHVQLSEAQSWLESTKTGLGAALDENMEASIASQVLSRVATAYDVSGWTTPENTPKLVRTVIAMKYASWYYNRSYSEEDGVNDYAILLDGRAEQLLDGIVTGANDLPEIEGTVDTLSGAGYELPADAVFTMGKIF